MLMPATAYEFIAMRPMMCVFWSGNFRLQCRQCFCLLELTTLEFSVNILWFSHVVRYAVIASGCAGCPKLHCERPGCGMDFCYHCKQPWHANQTCTAARAKRLSSVHSLSSMSHSLDSNIGSCVASMLCIVFCHLWDWCGNVFTYVSALFWL